MDWSLSCSARGCKSKKPPPDAFKQRTRFPFQAEFPLQSFQNVDKHHFFFMLHFNYFRVVGKISVKGIKIVFQKRLQVTLTSQNWKLYRRRRFLLYIKRRNGLLY